MFKAQFFNGVNAQEHDCHYTINDKILIIYIQSKKYTFPFRDCEPSICLGGQGGSIDFT